MKKLNIVVIIILISSALFSQSYHKFAKNGAIWNYYVTGSMVAPYDWLVTDSVGGDTIIGFFNYNKVYTLAQGYTYLEGAIREDTIQKKVYYHDFVNESPLYDFSLKTGDSIFYSADATCCSYDYFKTVDSIDVINISGQERKRWYLTNYFGNVFMPDIWIEGIGSVYRYGLFNPLNPDIVMDNSTPYFGCFSSDSITYVDTANCASSCPCTNWLVNVNDLVSDKVKVYPNPASDFIIIDLQSELPNYAELYSVKGRFIKRIDLNPNTNRLSLKSLKSGLYFIKIIGNKDVLLRKIIKVKH